MGKWRHGVILDAGSSGTRVHIYRWLKSDKAREAASGTELHRLPEIGTDKKWTKKIHPGISTFGSHPQDVGPEHLQGLFKHALKHIPAEEVPNTPLFLLATAGMRILPTQERRLVLHEVCEYARETTRFHLPDCDVHVQVIPGETEGLYGWIAANYLLGGFDDPKGHAHGKDHHTYGFLDMGGASAQIAFAPNGTEAAKHADDLTVLRLRSIDGSSMEYKVFVTTWLGFGVNQARQRYVKALLNASAGAKKYPDPCLPTGAKVAVYDDGTIAAVGKNGELLGSRPEAQTHTLVGTSSFKECLRKTYPLLEKEKKCLDAPCLINGQHVPAIDFDVNHFVGVSEYYHTTHEIFKMALKDDEPYDFESYSTAVEKFCNQSWKQILGNVGDKKFGKKIDQEKAQEVCFKSSWLINVLHDGIGIPRVGIEDLGSTSNVTKAKVGGGKSTQLLNPFQAVNKINDVELSWTLGKMVLYASSEVPPTSKHALAVGFGSNNPKLDDFQLPGSAYTSSPGSWRDRLLRDHPRRLSSVVILGLIVFVIGIMLCGRDRRRSALQRLRRMSGLDKYSSPGRRNGLAGKLFGHRRTPTYERVLEDGEAADNLELGQFSDSEHDQSDSSDGGRLGRTSGWLTPQIKVDAGGAEVSSFFEPGRDIVAEGNGLGISPGAFSNPIDRGGLMARTDSRERLAAGRRSRPGSPKRARSNMDKVDE